MPSKAISQMNIRINSQVKDAGNRVLVEGGVFSDDVAPLEETPDVDRYAEALVERMRERDLW